MASDDDFEDLDAGREADELAELVPDVEEETMAQRALNEAEALGLSQAEFDREFPPTDPEEADADTADSLAAIISRLDLSENGTHLNMSNLGLESIGAELLSVLGRASSGSVWKHHSSHTLGIREPITNES